MPTPNNMSVFNDLVRALNIDAGRGVSYTYANAITLAGDILAGDPSIAKPKTKVVKRVRLDPFTKGYVEAAMRDHVHENKPLGSFLPKRAFDVNSLKMIKDYCKVFQTKAAKVLKKYPNLEELGRDFYYTRQRKGFGFYGPKYKKKDRKVLIALAAGNKILLDYHNEKIWVNFTY